MAAQALATQSRRWRKSGSLGTSGICLRGLRHVFRFLGLRFLFVRLFFCRSVGVGLLFGLLGQFLDQVFLFFFERGATRNIFHAIEVDTAINQRFFDDGVCAERIAVVDGQ